MKHTYEFSPAPNLDIYVEFKYTPEVQSYWNPPEPAEVEILTLIINGTRVASIDDMFLEAIENYILENWK